MTYWDRCRKTCWFFEICGSARPKTCRNKYLIKNKNVEVHSIQRMQQVVVLVKLLAKYKKKNNEPRARERAIGI